MWLHPDTKAFVCLIRWWTRARSSTLHPVGGLLPATAGLDAGRHWCTCSQCHQIMLGADTSFRGEAGTRRLWGRWSEHENFSRSGCKLRLFTRWTFTQSSWAALMFLMLSFSLVFRAFVKDKEAWSVLDKSATSSRQWASRLQALWCGSAQLHRPRSHTASPNARPWGKGDRDPMDGSSLNWSLFLLFFRLVLFVSLCWFSFLFISCVNVYSWSWEVKSLRAWPISSTTVWTGAGSISTIVTMSNSSQYLQ